MDFPRASKSVGSIFENIKDKISFQGRSNERDQYYEEDYYEDADAYDQHGADYGSAYDSYDREPTVRTRAAARGQVSRGQASRGQAGTSPQLVSAGAARASTAALGATSVMEPVDAGQAGYVGSVHERGVAGVQGGYRSSDHGGYSSSYPDAQAAQAVATQRFRMSEEEATSRTFVEGYDTPATGYSDFVSPYKERKAQTASPSSFGDNHQTGLDKLFTPTDGNESRTPTYARSFSRGVTTLRPMRYEDVESIAPAVKSGEIVALVLTLTNADLAKRVLDFTFGVASALDARVECVADNVFVVVCGGVLTLEEKHELRKHGIVLKDASL